MSKKMYKIESKYERRATAITALFNLRLMSEKAYCDAMKNLILWYDKKTAE